MFYTHTTFCLPLCDIKFRKCNKDDVGDEQPLDILIITKSSHRSKFKNVFKLFIFPKAQVTSNTKKDMFWLTFLCHISWHKGGIRLVSLQMVSGALTFGSICLYTFPKLNVEKKYYNSTCCCGSPYCCYLHMFSPCFKKPKNDNFVMCNSREIPQVKASSSVPQSDIPPTDSQMRA